MGTKAVVAVTRGQGRKAGTDQNIRPGVKAPGRRDAVGLHGNRHPPMSYRQKQTVKGVLHACEGTPAPRGPRGEGPRGSASPGVTLPLPDTTADCSIKK